MRSKKPNGLSQNETVSAGMIGQSSGRVMWWMPKVYQSTTSVLSMLRLAFVHSPSPLSVADWFTNSPAGQRSSGLFGVTHTVWPMTSARANTGEAGSNMAGMASPGTSL